jgi:hypothetical protein
MLRGRDCLALVGSCARAGDLSTDRLDLFAKPARIGGLSRDDAA